MRNRWYHKRMPRRTLKLEAIMTSPLLSPRHVDDIREQIPDLLWAGDPWNQNSPTKISVKLPELQFNRYQCLRRYRLQASISPQSVFLRYKPPPPHPRDLADLFETPQGSKHQHTASHTHPNQRNAPRYILLLARPTACRRPAMERAAPVPRPDPHTGRRRWVQLPRDGQHKGHVRGDGAH